MRRHIENQFIDQISLEERCRQARAAFHEQLVDFEGRQALDDGGQIQAAAGPPHTFDSNAFERLWHGAALRLAPLHLVSSRLAPLRFVPLRLAPLRFVPLRSGPSRLALRLVPLRAAPLRGVESREDERVLIAEYLRIRRAAEVGIEHHPQGLPHPGTVSQPHIEPRIVLPHRTGTGQNRGTARSPGLHVGA